ncbi:hypothetical protein [Streptomyces sp. NPDC002845]
MLREPAPKDGTALAMLLDAAILAATLAEAEAAATATGHNPELLLRQAAGQRALDGAGHPHET